MVRPLSGTNALAAAMGERFEALGPDAAALTPSLSAPHTHPTKELLEKMAISKVGVVGGGLMGHGIAQICAQAGWDVVLREVDDETAAKAVGKIEKQLGRAVEKGRMEQSDADAVRGRIDPTTDYGDLADCDLVIEAMTEDLDGKLEMWREVDPIVKEDAFFATNTSSLAVIDQAAATVAPGPLPRPALLQPGAGDAAARGRADRDHLRRGAEDRASRSARS